MEKKLRIAIVCPWYSGQFGYIVNNLPKALVKQGAEAFIITSDSQLFSNTPDFNETYKDFIGDKFVTPGIYVENGVTIHRLPHKLFRTEMHFEGLNKTLRTIKPDVVQIYDLNSIITFKLAIFKPFRKYIFFNANHILASVFPLASEWKNASWLKKLKWKLLHVLPGRFIYRQTDLTIYPTPDAKDLALRFMGFKDQKNITKPLAVDTDLYLPISDADKQSQRIQFDLKENEFVCIYSGRFSEDKNPLVLARAIAICRNEGLDISGIFVGDGVQKQLIAETPGCKIHPFVNQEKLARFYGMADVGVWPRQESTSMLDCLSCGTPVILNNTIKAIERVEGNGELFELDNIQDLVKKIKALYENPEIKKQYGTYGRSKILTNFSWNKYAADYIQLLKPFLKK